MQNLSRVLILIVIFCTTVISQVATSATYTLEQSVIANGGGASGGTRFGVEGTAGQASAGTHSSSTTFSVHGGFWQSLLLPTAAHVSVSGQCISADGQALDHIRLTLIGASETRSALTNSFGNFRFDDIEVGGTYIIRAAGKGFQFVPQLVTVQDQISDLRLSALP